jgi:iron complex outermembrane receptor protein
MFDVGWNIQFDSTLRYVDVLPTVFDRTGRVVSPKIPSYVTLDLRLAWSPRKDLEFAVVGRNLLDNHHPEFAPTFIGTPTTEVERSVYGMVVWHY